MQTVRRVGAGLLWVVASLLGLVSLVLCLTIILLPLGIPLLLLTGRLFRVAMRLWAPRGVSHPVDELGKKARSGQKSIKGAAKAGHEDLRKRTRRARKQLIS